MQKREKLWSQYFKLIRATLNTENLNINLQTTLVSLNNVLFASRQYFHRNLGTAWDLLVLEITFRFLNNFARCDTIFTLTSWNKNLFVFRICFDGHASIHLLIDWYMHLCFYHMALVWLATLTGWRTYIMFKPFCQELRVITKKEILGNRL